MITAMIKMPDGKIINKILGKDIDDLEDAVRNDRINDAENGVVILRFDDMYIVAHWSNVVITMKDSQEFHTS